MPAITTPCRSGSGRHGARLALLAALWSGAAAASPALPAVAPPPPAGPSLRAAAAAAGLEIGAVASPADTLPGSAVGAILARDFSSLTPENHMKWSLLEPTPGQLDFASADAIVAFAEANGQRVRGHTLFWSRANGPPAWLEAEVTQAPDPAARLRALMQQHASAVVGRYAGRISQWDVVNEPLSFFDPVLDPENLYGRVLGESYLVEAFQLARAADPAARLFLNEIGVEGNPAKFQGLLALVQRLLGAGGPIDGIGLQSHFLFFPPDRAALETQIGGLAALGLDVELTELDIPLRLFAGEADPLAAQARAYGDVLAACLAVPRCSGITLWGVSDADSWLDDQPIFSLFAPNRPLLFDEALEAKPAWYAARDALLAVPEPSSALLVASGAALLAVRRRRAPPRRT